MSQGDPPPGGQPLAIVGMACRLPGGVTNHEALWRLVRDGIDAIAEIPAERFDTSGLKVRRAGLVDQFADFDPAPFGLSPREVVGMDPQQRWLLQLAWEALEDAGIAPDSLVGAKAAVFVGISSIEFLDRLREESSAHVYEVMGGSMSAAAGRVSFTFGLEGPSVCVATACSSALVATHLAVQSLRRGESDLALVGGVQAILSRRILAIMSHMNMLSPRAQCRAFDASADGYARGEGGGVLAIKRLADAMNAGDPIWAVIRGSAMNQDGRSPGLTVPRGAAQEAVYRDALADAGLEPSDVDYIETHGTGTPLGDPIEANSIAAVYGRRRPGAPPLAIGSIKTNIGHLEAGAGAASLMKAALALKHREIPRQIHLSTLNPHIRWEGASIRVATENAPWPEQGRPGRAGVSGFAATGTNVHVILEAPPRRSEAPPSPRTRHVLALSAKAEPAVRAYAAKLRDHVLGVDDGAIADICRTMNVGRAKMDHRAVVSAASASELAIELGRVADGTEPVVSLAPGEAVPPVAFVFGEGGEDRVRIAGLLRSAIPAFRTSFDRCLEALAIEEAPHAVGPASELAIGFAIEVSLAAAWRAWGIEPTFAVGYGTGEIASAVASGMLSLEDGARLVVANARLAAEVGSRGASLHASLSRGRAEALLAGREHLLSLAAIDGREAIRIAGEASAVEALALELSRMAIEHRVEASAATRSPLGAAHARMLSSATASIVPRAGSFLVASSLTGSIEPTGLVPASYWAEQALGTIRFRDAVAAVVERGARVFIGLGSAALLALTRNAVDEGEGGGTARSRDMLWVASTAQRATGTFDPWVPLLRGIARLFLRGARIDWAALEEKAAPRRSLPTYPWQNRDFPVPTTSVRGAVAPDAGHAGEIGRVAHPMLTEALRVSGQRIWRCRVESSRYPWISDHVISGVPVLPGVTFLELAHAAGNVVFGGRPFVVRELECIEMFRVPRGATYELETQVAIAGPESASVRFFGRPVDDSGDGVLHAMARLESAPAATDLHLESLTAIRSRMTDSMTGAEFYADCEIAYGPSMRAIESLHVGEAEAIGALRRPDVIASDGAYTFHPAVLDACIQVSGSVRRRIGGASGMRVPVRFDRWRVLGPPERELWSWARLRDAGTKDIVTDVVVFGASGRPVAELVGLHSRSIERRTGPSDELLYEVLWSEARSARVPTARGGRRIVVASEEDRASAEHLSRLLGPRTIVVLPERESLRRVACTSEEPCSAIVHVASSREAEEGREEEAALRAQCRSLLVSSEVAAEIGAERSPRMWIVTTSAQAVEGAPARPLSAALWGIGRVLAQEHPGLNATLVDLGEDGDGDIAALAREIEADGPESQLAIRRGHPFVPRVVPSPPDGSGRRGLREDATYIVTGGLGGLGLTIARHWLQRGVRRLVLLGRSAPSETVSMHLADLRRLHTSVHLTTHAVDVADRGALETLLAQITKEGPPIRGIVHAAGVLRDGALATLSVDDYVRVVRPKILGARNLAAAAARLELDFLAFFSSAASVFAGRGRASYAAGNAFLDAYAAHLRARGVPATALGWGAFAEVGMAAAAARRPADQPVTPIPLELGMRLFDELLVPRRAHVMPLLIDAPRWLASQPVRLPLFERLASAPAIAPPPETTRLSIEGAASDDKRRLVREFLVGEVARVLRLPPAEVHLEHGLAALGGDSITGMELADAAQARLGVRLPVPRLLAATSLSGVIDELLSMLGERRTNGEPDAPHVPEAPVFVEYEV